MVISGLLWRLTLTWMFNEAFNINRKKFRVGMALEVLLAACCITVL